MYRYGNAFGVMGQYQVNEQLRVGYAFDMTTTKLGAYNAGTHEIVLGYDFKFTKGRTISPVISDEEHASPSHLVAVALGTCGPLVGTGQCGSSRPHCRPLLPAHGLRTGEEEYKIAADLGAVNEHVVKRLADCSMKLGDTKEGDTVRTGGKYLNREPLDLYMYAQALKGNRKYAEAEEWMDRYLAMARNEEGSKKNNIVDFAKKFTSNLDRFTVKRVTANSPMDDMAVTWDGMDRVLFSSSRDTTVGMQWRSAWNDQPFLDLYSASRQPDGDLIGGKRVSGNVNSKLHEGPAVVAPDGTLWYTRTNAAKSKNGIHRLSILHAQRDGDGWKGDDPFLYNNPRCSVGHPAISSEGKWFYFVSDMPGGYGGADIYVCENREANGVNPGTSARG